MSAQWVEDKIRAEVNHSLAVALAEVVAPLANKLELAEVKLFAIGAMLEAVGSDVEYSGRSLREALSRLNNTSYILAAACVKDVEDALGVAGIYMPPAVTEMREMLRSAPWEQGNPILEQAARELEEEAIRDGDAVTLERVHRIRRRRNDSEPIPQRTQDAIIEDVLEQVDDDLDF